MIAYAISWSWASLVYRDENLSDWVCVKIGRGGAFGLILQSGRFMFFDDQNINICLCFIGILIILGVHFGDLGGGDS